MGSVNDAHHTNFNLNVLLRPAGSNCFLIASTHHYLCGYAPLSCHCKVWQQYCVTLVQCTTVLTQLLHLVSTLRAAQACSGYMYHCLQVDSGDQVATQLLPTRDTGKGLHGLPTAETSASQPVSPC